MKRIAVCVGGRPNYIKLAPIVRAIDDTEDLECVLIDAKQHYDRIMTFDIAEEVGLRDPDWFMQVGGAGRTQAEQTAAAMLGMEDRLLKLEPFDAVLVHGDMNYALGCALAAVKLHIPVIHNEAGLRSFDRRMPEEINRKLIDQIATTHFVTEKAAMKNLGCEGIIGTYMVGSTLPESINYVCDGIPLWDRTIERDRIVVTLHRPDNVDDPEHLRAHMKQLEDVRHRFGIEVILYCHPRTQKRLDECGYAAKPGNLAAPCGYKDFLEAMLHASLVITDSGGIQEETTVLGIPCLTWRNNTERPVTCNVGTNRMATGDMVHDVERMLEGDGQLGLTPDYWDGKASSRIVEILRRRIN